MANIIIGFSKPNKWKPFSALIMAGYSIPYDHVYIRYQSAELGQSMIFQASQLAVNFMSQTMFDASNVVVREFSVQITDAQMAALLQFAGQNVGKPYGIEECFGLAYVRIMELLGKRINNPLAFTGSTYVCSELAGYVCEQFAGMNIDADPANITPKEMYDYMVSKYGS